ncbi:MAG: UBA/THIF-type binding protein [Chthoniobacteraceae bacterium]|nr:UBA/THIF-type binding protein [Chthoniobacteraceae bacterium]
MIDDYLSRFGGIARLYGLAGLKQLRGAHVCVIGVGGVGSWAVEGLVRSGIGAITMIDLDDVCVTNVNRQLPALDGQIGRAKVDVLAERMRLINPGCELTVHTEFFTASTAEHFLTPNFDFVVDAIDKMTNKCLIIAGARDRGLAVLTVGGAGGRRDGSAVRVVDLADSTQDELLRQVRRKLRRDFGFPAGPQTPTGVACVYSPEKPLFPWSDGTACHTREPGSTLTLDCATGFGTAVFVTAAFGFAAAGEVVRQIATKERAGL